MVTPVLVRGFRPRPYKSKSGEQKYYGTFVILDLSERPIMETVELERSFDSEADMARAAQMVGKQGTAVIDGMRVGQDGQARFSGVIEAVKG